MLSTLFSIEYRGLFSSGKFHRMKLANLAQIFHQEITIIYMSCTIVFIAGIYILPTDFHITS